MGPGTGGQEVTRNWNESLLANETDTYQIVIGPGRAYLSAQTYGPAFQQCASGADTTLVRDDATNRTVIQTGTGPGNSNCAAIDPMTNSAALLDPGTYRLRVRHATGAAIPAYELRVQIVGEICGNGFVENAGLPMGEECDDRNTMSMDGCSSTCRFEGAREVEPNDAFGTATTVGQNPATTLGALTTSDEDYYRIVIPANVHLEAFVTTNGRTTCDNTRLMRLNLFDTDGQLVLATNLNGGPGGFCGRIDPSIAPVASRLPAGTYYLSVTEDLDRDVPLYYLHTNLVTASCGNGYLDANEECDDGNTTATDGCDSMCRLTVAAGTTSPPGGRSWGPCRRAA